jgi:carbamate kinase
MKEDAGRGWRRVIASPLPVRIVEIETVKALLAGGTVVITCGGGGIPVTEGQNGLEGVAAVIDKDFSAERLAEEIDADVLLILTEVEKAALYFGKPEQVDLGAITVAEAERYIAGGHFAPGSMLPKIQAAVRFAKTGKKAIITALDKAIPALEGKTGTVVTA